MTRIIDKVAAVYPSLTSQKIKSRTKLRTMSLFDDSYDGLGRALLLTIKNGISASIITEILTTKLPNEITK